MSKQYIKLYEDGTSDATLHQPSWGTSSIGYDGFGEVYENGVWYDNVAVFKDDFSTDTSGDYSTSNSADVVYRNNALDIVENGSDYPYIYRVLSIFTIGKKYKLFAKSSNTANIYVRSSDGSETLGTKSISGSGFIDFIATDESLRIMFLNPALGGSGNVVSFDNIAVIPLNDDESIDLSNATVQTSHTYLSKDGKLLGVEVANGQPVDLHYNELAPTLVEDTIQATDVKTNTLTLAETKWINEDGIEYFDEGLLGVPDTTFSSTGARIYPDGTIRGKSSYGEYVKYADGTALYKGTLVFDTYSNTTTLEGTLTLPLITNESTYEIYPSFQVRDSRSGGGTATFYSDVHEYSISRRYNSTLHFRCTVNGASFTSGQTLIGDYFFIGRWK